MSGANLTSLLLRVRDAGMTLRVREETGGLVYSPADRLTGELREELVSHKPELLELLAWRESVAHELLQDAMAYLAEFYIEAGSPECELVGLDAYEDAVNEAFAARDMFRLRVAVREWVEAGLVAFRAKDRDRGAA